MSMGNEAGARKVFIVGAPRSGSTWVSEILATAPGARLVHEPDNHTNDPYALVAKAGIGAFPIAGVDDAPPELAELWRAAFEHGERSGWRNTSADFLLQRVARPTRRAIVVGDAGRRGEWIVRAIRPVARPRSDGAEADVTVVKSVHGAFSTDLVVGTVNPVVAVVVRHPLNTLASWLEMGWQPFGLDEDRRYFELAGIPHIDRFPASTAAEHYASNYAVLHHRLHRLLRDNPSFVAADHEQLCVDPTAEFEALFRRLGVTWTDASLAAVEGKNAHGEGYVTQRVAIEQPERWRSRLGADQLGEILPVLAHYEIDVDTGPATEPR